MRTLSYLIIFFLAPAIILLNFRLLVTNHNYYQKEFEKLGVYNTVDKNTAVVQSERLVKYLCCNGHLDPEFFTKREVLHLADVKSRVLAATTMLFLNLGLVILIATILLAKKKRQILLWVLKTGSLVGILAILTLSASSFINFDFLFLKFHLISFTNDLWLLPPESNLIKLFPQQFFQDSANRIATRSVIMLGIIYLLSILIEKSFSKGSKSKY
ncbi:DUF1461 domain-containing protein [Candidatus Curtissbacteria bacterium]|nr:DUF1461 domain-containing protein [Candidatus Curtissbacteria bacterium]